MNEGGIFHTLARRRPPGLRRACEGIDWGRRGPIPMLGRSGAHHAARDGAGRPALEFAASMVKAGADVDKWDLFGRSPLYMAAT